MPLSEPSTFPIMRTEEDSECTLLGSTLCQAYEPGTSHRLGLSARYRIIKDTETTSWVITGPAITKTLTTVVRQLRDHISAQTRLTRQEIARAIGVDRRSLSGFVSGEIRPTPERIIMLQTLATTAEWAASEFGEHVREVLRGESSDTSPLRLIAEGRTDIRHDLHVVAVRTGLVETTGLKIRRRESREPLYITAAAIWDLQQEVPLDRGTARDQTMYEQDLSKAVSVKRTPSQTRRRYL